MYFPVLTHFRHCHRLYTSIVLYTGQTSRWDLRTVRTLSGDGSSTSRRKTHPRHHRTSRTGNLSRKGPRFRWGNLCWSTSHHSHSPYSWRIHTSMNLKNTNVHETRWCLQWTQTVSRHVTCAHIFWCTHKKVVEMYGPKWFFGFVTRPLWLKFYSLWNT